MSPANGDFIIRGVTLQGRRFRPSDWAERLCGAISQTTGGANARSTYVYPVNSDGAKCVMVEARLADLQPMAYRFLVAFARDNELQVSAVCALPLPADEEKPVKPAQPASRRVAEPVAEEA